MTEPIGNNYARAQINSFTSPSNGSVVNQAEIHFPRSTGIWFTHDAPASYWVMFDGNQASSNILAYGQLRNVITVYGNVDISIPAKYLEFSILEE